jgi:predicted nucleic acid-binding protein
MKYLLDTNVLCEPLRAKPDESVRKWFRQMPNHALYVSVLTIGEIRKGVEKISDQKRKQKIKLWLENSIPELFQHRVLPITFEIADRWGRLQYQVKRPMPAIDCLLAATALHHDMVLVTRNTKDYAGCAGLEMINPWL